MDEGEGSYGHRKQRAEASIPRLENDKEVLSFVFVFFGHSLVFIGRGSLGRAVTASLARWGGAGLQTCAGSDCQGHVVPSLSCTGVAIVDFSTRTMLVPPRHFTVTH